MREIPDWPGYHVSDDGRVFSTVRGVARELNRFDRRDRHGRPTGYLSVTLSRDGFARTHYVHQLVLSAWVGPRPEGAEVLHGDGHRSNNALSNLRYGSRRENAADRERHGTVARGASHGRARHTAETIREIRRRIASGHNNASIARALGVNSGTVSFVRHGKQWSSVA